MPNNIVTYINVITFGRITLRSVKPSVGLTSTRDCSVVGDSVQDPGDVAVDPGVHARHALRATQPTRYKMN